ncbi:aspartyl protease family protein [Bacteroides neonati]|uniref:aspartyl protease family protein n=1 Tax=Bacteroides neonati TaxID=1347393 RepID=UPI0004AE9AF0|nr:aspartyl protease family protein [Bacteroides neonati]
MNNIIFYKVVKVLSFVFIIIASSSCGLGAIGKYATYTSSIGDSLPDTFRVEVPMAFSEGWFTIDGKMNGQEMPFIIDTGAFMCLAQTNTLAEIGATLWGTFPIKSLNAYGEKTETTLYYPHNFELYGLSFKKPLFTAISPNEYIYDFASKPILGDNLIKALYWKFSMDERKIILFGKEDKALLNKEVKGYAKIEMGASKKTELTIRPLGKSREFLFDLGFNSEIRVDRETFTELSKQIMFKKYRYTFNDSITDTLFLSDYVNVEWGGVEVKDCRIAHAAKVDHNLIGSRFMQRLNFVLAFESLKKRLYIQPSATFKLSESTAYFSDFGFDLKQKEEEAHVALLEVGGLAEAAGLQLQDKVLSIDNGAFDLHAEDCHDRLSVYLRDKQSINIRIERGGQIMEFNI